MKPKKIPKFHVNNVYKGEEYELGKKKTVTGWLKHMFLWHEDGTSASAKDHLDYSRALKLFKDANKIPQGLHLDDWEEKHNCTQFIDALNKFRELYYKEKKK